MPNCNYTINGGTLNIGSLTKSIGTFQITGGTLTGTSSGQLTSNAAYDIEAGLVAVKLAGSGIALNKTTTGTAILTGSNTYTGATTISAGTLQLGTGTSAGSLSSSTTIAVTTGAIFDYNLSTSMTLTARVSGAGTLQKDGAGTLTMSGANTFSGNLIVNAGTLGLQRQLARRQLHDQRGNVEYQHAFRLDRRVPDHRRHGHRQRHIDEQHHL